MLKIADLEISCFRSILNLKLCIESEPNLISICGENNVGKTNTLRAINLFLILKIMKFQWIDQH